MLSGLKKKSLRYDINRRENDKRHLTRIAPKFYWTRDRSLPVTTAAPVTHVEMEHRQNWPIVARFLPILGTITFNKIKIASPAEFLPTQTSEVSSTKRGPGNDVQASQRQHGKKGSTVKVSLASKEAFGLLSASIGIFIWHASIFFIGSKIPARYQSYEKNCQPGELRPVERIIWGAFSLGTSGFGLVLEQRKTEERNFRS